MKRLIVFLSFVLIVSCDYFNVKKTSTETILNEELKTFKWNEVDNYPSFSSCGSASDKVEQKRCFEQTLSQHILSNLLEQNIVVTQNINDTLFIDFTISEIGKLSLTEVKVDSLILSEIPEIKTFINQSLVSLPKILPAIKRGQHVKTQFKLPIVIAVD